MLLVCLCLAAVINTIKWELSVLFVCLCLAAVINTM